MDLDSKAHSMLVNAWNSGRSDEYTKILIRILERLSPLAKRHDHETPEMWCSRIRNPFRKILEDNPRILSKNGYITMCGKLIERSDRVHGYPTNYIYCSVCDSLVFISENDLSSLSKTYRDNHLKRCISGNSISNECARRKEILQSIDKREFQIWQYKQYILQEELKIKRLQLELASQFQSLSHTEKDKLASISYDYDTRTIHYEAYAQAKASMPKNTMSTASNFEPACILVTSDNQEMVSLTSYQLLAPNETTSKIFISSQYAKQNNLLPSINYHNQSALRLGDGTKITFV
ncbi:hypothetical protein RhiirC2_817953 [Rhizophagus irregularis]|uniref:Uncharacterized protein n=1 Tax=Rhizophagus irregularis TaxID=588596 RepID=A0A2N1MGP2_9GLOM|nr:hypothetical protein RhiirC2_817953 [Rhizophagus irregularis]